MKTNAAPATDAALDRTGAEARIAEVLARTTAAALAVSGAEPGRVFEDLARGLARVLGTDAALIGVFVDPQRTRMQTLAAVFDGRLLRPFEYDVTQTPCRHIVGRSSRFVPRGVQSEFAPGSLFSVEKFDAYAGYSILNAAGEQLGIIVALDRKPIVNQELTEALLRIFAVRAAAEIERQRADAALAASESSYRAIFESAEDAIFVHDWDSGAVVDVNSAACRNYGWSREELMKIGIGDISSNVPPYTAASAARYIEAARRGEVIRFEWQRRNRDGSLHWDEVVLKAATIGGVQRVLAFTREISDRKRAEEALRASEEQYRAIFNASADALVLRDADFRIVDVNATYERMSGWAREEVLGLDRVVANPADVAPSIVAQHARALGGEAIVLEVPLVRRDGTRYELELRGVPIQHRGQPHVLYMGRDVTERKRAEHALRDSEEQYRAIFNASADALVLWNSQYRRVDVNAAYQTMYGWARDEMIGKGYEDPRFPADYAQNRLELVRRALNGEDCKAELEAIRSDGSRIQTEVHAIPFRHRGEPHVLAIARDITERKRAEQALRASEEQYRAIFEAAADSLQLLDAQHRVVDVNPAYERMYGKSRDEVVGKTLDDLVPADFRDERRALVERALAGTAAELQSTGFRRDGTPFDLEVRVIPFQHRGQPHVLGIARDITERKRAEAALRASEEQYRSIFNASADAMLLRDDRMMIVDANPAFQSLCGLARDQLVGLRYAPFVTEAYEAEAAMLLERALEGARGTLEAQTRAHDGSVIDVEVRAIPMLYGGRPHVLAIARNITAEKRAEAERVRFEARMRQGQKLEAIGQLTGGIAHDFNNILASVMGYVVLAEERTAEAGDARTIDYLNQALASCRRARDLIQQMLTFSRGGRGEPRALSLATVVRDALPMLRSALPSTLAIECECDDAVPAVWIDEVQAHQVLLNLAINARDAMPAGGALRIGVVQSDVRDAACASCRVTVGGPFVELTVGDCGHGIELALMERIFDPFFTTKAPGKGTGMGLSMVHGIVHEHRGHIVIESEPGRGSTFRILLPALGASAEERGSPGARSAVGAPLAGCVLLVDDEPSVLAVMRETLRSWGLAVEACASAEEAESVFARDPAQPDLLVTDHAMPRVTGIELAERLRARRPGLPWLLCTGYAESTTVARAKAGGASAVLRKPIERDELRAAVSAALRPRN